MWVTGKQHLVQLEFVAGIDTNEDRLVVYDGNMEETKLDERIEVSSPRQFNKNEELRKALTTNGEAELRNNIVCVIMETVTMTKRVWQWIVATNGARFVYIRARQIYYSRRRPWRLESVIRGRTPATLWKRIPNEQKKVFLSMIENGELTNVHNSKMPIWFRTKGGLNA